MKPLFICVTEQKALEEEKEQRVRELRKILKQQEKKLKREAYEAMERQKKTMAEESDKVLKGTVGSVKLCSLSRLRELTYVYHYCKKLKR